VVCAAFISVLELALVVDLRLGARHLHLGAVEGKLLGEDRPEQHQVVLSLHRVVLDVALGGLLPHVHLVAGLEVQRPTARK
jgi:hypothetical protein